MTVNNLKDLAIALGLPLEPRSIERLIERTVFKSTECGCTFRADEAGVYVSGYAEGADAECEEHALLYPFDEEQFWTELQEADDEGCAMFDEWNNE